ncbi:ABC-type glycerol-3-phosphate transport system substrate-binding protein [Friedmanniella endophytica]|uniref:ABC-type glycerol-3-phosphate transport system substrate-binding protein n=1 Tax=Microlunatus kandeliicorticis TaxID=1759536 RepID=A0A7W3IPU9_9ACTN|nr:sugar ABC transporter substrate-binding protein [Microlunatus kandeliicorticis]MBA8793028.1 ABC-type glycerol-3-phosphate transport system substrate-binding protein [Microlunatus kandeliicorticis]
MKVGAALGALLLAGTGCAIKTDSGSSSGGGSGTGTTTLTFWEYYQGTQLTWLQGRVKDFEAKNPTIKVNLVQATGQQFDQKLLASVATGTTPDLFINNIVVDYPTLQAGGVMADLTPYWDAYSGKKNFPENTTWTTDGKVYNLLPYTNLLGMYYNKDILQQYGIQPPTTLDEMTAAMTKIRAAGKYSGVALSGAPSVEGAWLFAPQFLGLGVNYCNLDANQAALSAAFQRVAAWRSDDALPRAAATWDQNASWQQFMTGKYAFGLNGNWQLGNVKKANFAYGTTQFPAPAGGKSQVFPGGEGYGIGAKSKNKDAAWKFLTEAILTPEAGESIYTEAGSIPVESQAADSDTLNKDPNAAPFVKAAQDTAAWPKNSQTAAMQQALGVAVSGVISGQTTAEAATSKAISTIDAAKQKGGGGCA